MLCYARCSCRLGLGRTPLPTATATCHRALPSVLQPPQQAPVGPFWGFPCRTPPVAIIACPGYASPGVRWFRQLGQITVLQADPNTSSTAYIYCYTPAGRKILRRYTRHELPPLVPHSPAIGQVP